LRTEYISERLALSGGTPLNVQNLRDRLQLLRQDPNVQQVNAELQPGASPGESELSVRVRDRQPFWLTLQVDNARPPSVGSEEIRLFAGDRNLTGHGDALELSYGIAHQSAQSVISSNRVTGLVSTNRTHGFVFNELANFGGTYTLPVTCYDTTLRLFGNKETLRLSRSHLIL